MGGLRSCIYRVPDLAEASSWYGKVFDATPYFENEFYIGFDIDGYELGLLKGKGPDRVELSGLSYWATNDIEQSISRFKAEGAKLEEEIMDVGDGVLLAALSDPWNNGIRLIENRFFQIGPRNNHPEPAKQPGVTACGGVFIKCQDPGAIKEWYRNNLGINAGQYGAVWQWRKEVPNNDPGFTVWSAFPADTTYLSPSEHDFMINYRVNDLEELLKMLKERNIEQVGKMESYEYGKFAWIMDPEGRKIELWEPVDEEYIKISGDRMAAE